MDHEFFVLLTMMEELGVLQGALNIESRDGQWLTVVHVTRHPRRKPLNWFKKREAQPMT